jgi:hypothetical protein
MDATQLSLVGAALVVVGLVFTWLWRSIGFLNRLEGRMDKVTALMEGTANELQFLRDSYWWLMAKVGAEPPAEKK